MESRRKRKENGMKKVVIFGAAGHIGKYLTRNNDENT